MILETIDWLFICGFFLFSLIVGISVASRAGTSPEEYFASGRSMPWWLLGISMVATTFSADTPNLVTDLVRQHGVAGNWMWWAFLLTGMVTVFIYARLWRRSEVLTDIEFYELRYSGKSAAFLRGFRALYLGIFFNVMIMATVLLAGVKIGGVILGLSPGTTVSILSVIVVIYTMLGGLRGVLITDFFQFIIAMAGAVAAAVTALKLPRVGGLSGLFAHPGVAGKVALIPDFSDTSLLMAVFVIPLAVQWWSVWYPGSEPGGGGYIAQRMLAAKNEKNAMGATMLFNVAHYALRPWPWIIVALASLIVFPDLQSLQNAFPDVAQNMVRHDMAYPAMLTFLPAGLMGLVIASLIAAVMSTISTHLNWGGSYIVNDFYRRFINREPEKGTLVRVGRMATLLLMVAAALVALLLENALQAFNILLQIGAGTGLLFLLRWFWWRINAAAEITAMLVSFAVAVYFEFIHPVLGFALPADWVRLSIGVGVTTACWIAAALLGKPADDRTLMNFYCKIHPGGPGWKRVRALLQRNGISDTGILEPWNMGRSLLQVALGVAAIYATLFATGFWLYNNIFPAVAASIVAVAASAGIFFTQPRTGRREMKKNPA